MAVRQASSANKLGAAGNGSKGHAGTSPPIAADWPGPATYAAAIRQAMDARHVTAAELASITGYSYEQVRRILKGEPIVSDQLNQLLCIRLALDPSSMWSVALHEKALRRFTSKPPGVEPLEEQTRLLAGFARLNDEDKRRVLKLLRRLEHAGE
jgi:hypothetical protein